MKKRLLIAMFAYAGIVSAQLVTMNIALQVQPSVLVDVQQHYISETSGTMGALVGALDAVTTTATVTVTQAALTQAPPVIGAGGAVVIDTEPMMVSAVFAVSGGIQLTLTRGTFQQFPLLAHLAGATVYALMYPSPYAMVANEALRPWMANIVRGLGSKSATLQSVVTGSVAIQ